MATLTAWLGLGMSHARKAISTLENFGGQLEKDITSATENYQKGLVAAEAAVEASRGDVALAETRLSESQKKVDDLKHALQDTTPQARLNAFIRNQVAKEEYTVSKPRKIPIRAWVSCIATVSSSCSSPR